MDDGRHDAAPWPPGDGAPTGIERLLALVDRLRDDRRLATAAGLAAVLVLVAGWWLWRAAQPPLGPRPEDVLPRVQLTPTTSVVTTTSLGPVLVHVVGAVAQPGVRELPAGARILDAVAAAGGATPDADLARLNLAAPVADGSQVRVPAAGEEIAGPLVVAPPVVGDGGPAGAAGPVDLNAATPAELEGLPGVGPATAAAIVAWRDANGPFVGVDQLLDVRGIGPAKFEALRDLVIVR